MTFCTTILTMTSITIPAVWHAPQRLLGVNLPENGQRCASNT
jgi:hypothetical protein